MRRDDDRAQSIQIGAVLLFGALVIALAGYQAFVVPQQNERVEFSHSQTVQNQLQDLRNAVVSMAGEPSRRSVSVTLGTRYPERLIAVNPGPPSGSLRTAGTRSESVAITVENAVSAGETGDFWTGSARRYSTGVITYRPNYNVYGGAPTTVYENGALVNEFPSGVVALASPSFVDGNRITLVALNGSLDATRTGSVSVDVRPVSGSATTISVTNDTTGNVTLRFPTRLGQDAWESLLSEQLSEGNVSSVSVATGDPFNTLTVELEGNRNYTLQMAKAGVGTGVTETDPAYLTEVRGDNASVPEDGSQLLVVEVRDAFNNPVPGVQVTGSAAGGSFAGDGTKRTGPDGRATFLYEAAPDAGGSTYTVSFSYLDSPTFTGTEPENVQMAVHVTDAGSAPASSSGGAPYAVEWTAPTTTADYTHDVSTDGNTLTLTATVDRDGDLVENASVDFAVNDTSVASLSSGAETTDATGDATTTLTVKQAGWVQVYAVSGGTSDVLNVSVRNVPTAPQVSSVTLGNDGSDNLAFSFDTNEQLGSNPSDVQVTVDSPSTTDWVTFDRNDFAETANGDGTYTYTLTTTQAYDDGSGTYTATVDDAVDPDGNNGGVNGEGSGLSDSYTFDNTPPTFGRAEAQARSTDGENKNIEAVDFTADANDGTAIDRIEARVYDKNGGLVGCRTFTSEPFYSQRVVLDSDVKVQGGGNYATVELTAYDTSGNSRTCTGQLDTTTTKITESSGFDCSQTTTAAVPVSSLPRDGGRGPPGTDHLALAALLVAVAAALGRRAPGVWRARRVVT